LKKIVFIINPKSGILKKDNISEVIESTLDKNKYDYQVKYTSGPGNATELCKQYVEQKIDIIVAVGGDGTINEVAKGLVNSESTLGIIPGGSGNGLAHHLDIPLGIKKAIEVINHGNSLKIDTGSLNGHLFVSIAGVGFDGLVAQKFAKAGFRGFVSYLKIVTEEYPRYKPKKYTLKIEDKLIKTKALFIAFANSDQFGFQTTIAPGAQVDDGLIDVIIAAKPPLIEIPILAGLLYWRKIDKSKYIQIYKASEIKITTRKKRWANIDGEALKTERKFTVRVQPGSLNIIVPAS